ncbi:hypothetical protein AVEN_93082-1 [Araneus ventricosus]|uniref:Uncharacterized protein n=1 Tax=Araneus ventricosus TaxID=182803 RepID=A0A4Y2J460_ARAVE|nr:hypothetical protein AVEN_93082-1 [Araneus ventricosus]
MSLAVWTSSRGVIGAPTGFISISHFQVATRHPSFSFQLVSCTMRDWKHLTQRFSVGVGTFCGIYVSLRHLNIFRWVSQELSRLFDAKKLSFASSMALAPPVSSNNMSDIHRVRTHGIPSIVDVRRVCVQLRIYCRVVPGRVSVQLTLKSQILKPSVWSLFHRIVTSVLQHMDQGVITNFKPICRRVLLQRVVMGLELEQPYEIDSKRDAFVNTYLNDVQETIISKAFQHTGFTTVIEENQENVPNDMGEE